MNRSTDRILTTHTGSLPRTGELLDALGFSGSGDVQTSDVQADLLREAVAAVVQRQVAAGLDVVSDGEMSKSGYSTYVTERMQGFGGTGRPLGAQQDVVDFPEWGDPFLAAIEANLTTPACIGDVSYSDSVPLERDIANFSAALQAAGATEGFVPAASPGVITMFLDNQHYATHEEYVHALAVAMKPEYDAIHAAGLVLQVDCPDLAAGHHVQFPDVALDEWKRVIAMHVDALNEATRDIPPDAMRIHLCWGNYEGPHNHDVELAEILDVVFKARPSGISFEAANPRHEHEWQVFETVGLPDDKVLIPGVIDSTTNYVEHPELVAQRIERFANLVGRERVIAGTDCGFATFAKFVSVVPSIAFAKLAALSDGAEIASRRLWRG